MPALSDLTILVVEDEYFLAREVADALLGEGAAVIGPVSSIKSAEDAIARERPDCAVLDMNLNGVSGADLARRLGRDGIPYLILTGYDTSALPEDLRHAPRIEKPTRLHSVIDALARFLGDTAAA